MVSSRCIQMESKSKLKDTIVGNALSPRSRDEWRLKRNPVLSLAETPPSSDQRSF